MAEPGRPDASAPASASGGGAMEARIHALDWAETPLGPAAAWPQSLRTAVAICLGSAAPALLLWGRDLRVLYNDAARAMLEGVGRPDALGRPGAEVWSGRWEVIGPVLEGVRAGGAPALLEDLLPLPAGEAPRDDAGFTFSCSGVPDGDGGVGGLIALGAATTRRVPGEQRLALLRDLGFRLAAAPDRGAIGRAVEAGLAADARALPFALVYLDGGAAGFRLAARHGLAAGHPAAPEHIDPGASAPWPLGRLRPVEVNATEGRRGESPSIGWRAPPERALVLPIAGAAPDRPAGFLVAGLDPERPLDARRRDFLEILAGQLAAALARVDAEACARRAVALGVEPGRDATGGLAGEAHDRGRIEGALLERERREGFLLGLEDRLRALADPEEIKGAAAGALAAALGAGRVVYLEIDGATGARRPAPRPVEGGAPEATGSGPPASPEGMEALRAGRPRVVPDADPRVRPAEQADGGGAGRARVVLDADADARMRPEQGDGGGAVLEAPLVKDGRLVGVLSVRHPTTRDWTAADVALVETVADRTWSAVERARAEAELRQREERQRFLLALVDRTRLMSDPDEIVAATTRALGERLAATRVAYAEIDENRGRATVRGGWTDGTAAHLPPVVALADFGSALMDRLRAGGVLRVEDTAASAVTRSSLAELEAITARAIISAPLFKDARFIGSLNVHQDRPRVWTDAEVALVEAIAERTWEAVERARAAARAADRDKRLRLALQAARMGEVSFDVQTGEVRHSPALAQLLGYPADASLTLRDIRASYHPEDVKRIRAAHRAMLESDAGFAELRHRVLLPDGTVRWVLACGDVTRAPDGTALAAFGIYLDLTERHLAEDRLRESEERHRLIIDSANDFAIIALDAEGVITSWNRGAERLLGFTEAEALGLPGSVFFTPEDRATGQPEEEMRRARERGLGENDRWHLRKDGSRFWGSGLVQPLADGHQDGYVKIFRDRTREHAAEMRERAALARLRHAAELAQVAPFTWRPLTGELDWPDSLKAMWGLAPEARVDLDILLAGVHPDDLDAVERQIARARDPGQDGRYEAEFRVRAADGVARRVLARGQTTFVDGAPAISAGAVMDVTRQRADEALLRDSEARMQLAMQAGGAATWDLDLVTGRNVWSDSHFTMLGLEPTPDRRVSEAVWRAAVASVDLPAITAEWERAERARDLFRCEHRLVRADGSVIWVKAAGRFDHDAAGRALRFSGVIFDITDRRHAEDALREAHDGLAALVAEREATLSQLAEGVVVADAAGSITFVNEAAERLHGARLLGVAPADYTERYHLLTEAGEPHPPLELPLARAVLGGETVLDARWRIRRPGGSEIVAIGSARPVRDAAGARSGAVLTLRDDTARLEAEAALRESEERYRALTELSPQFVFRSRPDGGITYVNRLTLEFTGRTREALLGDGWAACVHPDHRSRLRKLWRASNASRAPFEAEIPFRRADGVHRSLLARASPIMDERDAIAYWIGTALDVEDRRQAEREVQRSEERLRSLVSVITDVPWTTDAEGCFVTPQAAWSEYTGQSWEEHRGFGWTEALHPEDRDAVLRRWDEARSGGAIYSSRGRFRHAASNGYRHFLGRAVPVRDADGGIREWVGAYTDVHERVRHEEHQQLLINELNHRVKNTLAMVQSMATQTLRSSETTAEAQERFGSRLIALAKAHDILTRENWEGASLGRVVEDVIAPHGGRIERFRIAGPEVWVPPKWALALAMALHELATNAVKYGALSVGGGVVAIDWTVTQGPGLRRLRMRWRERGGLRVRPPARRGFGSRLVERGLAQDLGGEVTLEFAPGGVVCTIDAPLAPPGDHLGPPPGDESGAPPGGESGAPPGDDLGAPPGDESGAPPGDDLGAPPGDAPPAPPV